MRAACSDISLPRVVLFSSYALSRLVCCACWAGRMDDLFADVSDEEPVRVASWDASSGSSRPGLEQPVAQPGEAPRSQLPRVEPVRFAWGESAILNPKVIAFACVHIINAIPESRFDFFMENTNSTHKLTMMSLCSGSENSIDAMDALVWVHQSMGYNNSFHFEETVSVEKEGWKRKKVLRRKEEQADDTPIGITMPKQMFQERQLVDVYVVLCSHTIVLLCYPIIGIVLCERYGVSDADTAVPPTMMIHVFRC